MLEPVTLTVRACLPGVPFVFQLVDALLPLTAFVLRTLLSTINVKVFGPLTFALIDTTLDRGTTFRICNLHGGLHDNR